MKIWHISDTHTMHGWLQVPTDVDMVIFSGDCSNPSDPYLNEPEVRNFIEWYASLPIKHKIFVAGNHDISIEKRLVTPADIASKGIVYLENTSTNIDGLNIFGTPVSPSFGVGWAYNRSRDKMDKLWKSIPENTDIIVSHGPPKGVLDLSYNRDNELEYCGCSAMKKNMLRLKPKAVLFGHIHNFQDITNAGTMKVYGQDTIFSNGSCAHDGKFMNSNYFNHGNIIEL
jgi:Icc-related predicted phosphoesterase